MTSWSYITLLSLVFPVMLRTVNAERDSILYCGACIALVEEISWQTGITDPKKKIQIGSFQLDAKGNMNAREVKLKTSEVHLTEVMESVCRYMHYYAKNTDQNGNTNYIRIASRDGNEISKKHTKAIDDIRNTLQFACDYILEHHEDQLFRMYKAEEEEITEKLCVDIAGLCTKQNVSDQMWAYAGAVMLGMTEKAASKGDKKAQEMLEDETDDDDSDTDADGNAEEVSSKPSDETDEKTNEDADDQSSSSNTDLPQRVEL